MSPITTVKWAIRFALCNSFWHFGHLWRERAGGALAGREVCPWAVILPTLPPRCVSTPLTIWGGDFEIRQRDSFRASVVVLLFGFSKCFFSPPSCWNLQLPGSKCVFTGAHTAAGLLRYLTKFFRERQTSTCLGRSSSRSTFRLKSHATERATWRAKVVSLTSALIQKLPCGRQVD